MANVKILHEVKADWTHDGWRLCFHWCEYHYDDDHTQLGYRFIWRRPNGNLQAGRAQARLPSIAEAESLIAKAKAEGWGDHDDGERGEWTRDP
jgi:hypothetical protein